SQAAISSRGRPLSHGHSTSTPSRSSLPFPSSSGVATWRLLTAGDPRRYAQALTRCRCPLEDVASRTRRLGSTAGHQYGPCIRSLVTDADRLDRSPVVRIDRIGRRDRHEKTVGSKLDVTH